jgi:hypothetical protein
MKIGLSFVTLASVAMLALSAGMAQARVGAGEGQATVAKAQAAEAAAAWQHIEATYFNKTKQHHHRSRPDYRAGLRGLPDFPH